MLRISVEILEKLFFNLKKNKTREYLLIWLAFVGKIFSFLTKIAVFSLEREDLD